MFYRPPESHSLFSKLGGKVYEVLRHVDLLDTRWSAFNPSIAYSPKRGYAMLVRSSNFYHNSSYAVAITVGATVTNRLFFSELDDDLNPTNLREIDMTNSSYRLSRGLEDARLYWRGDSWQFTAAMLESPHTPYARVVTATLDENACTIDNLVKYPGLAGLRPEKNWILVPEGSPHFDFIYGPNAVIKDGLLLCHMHDSELTAGMHGSTNLEPLDDGTFIAVTHRRFINYTIDGEQRRYFHYFVRYNHLGQLLSVSRPFCFYSPGIEFAAGIASRGDDFVISLGVNDVSSHFAVISKDVAKTLSVSDNN